MPDRLPPSDLELLRLLADGELADVQLLQAQQLVQGESEACDRARAVVEGERNLQHAIGRVMSATHAPQSLVAQIQATLASGEVSAAAQRAEHPVEMSSNGSVAGHIERGGHATSARRPSPLWWLFSSPQRANFAAVAAVLTLIAGAVLFGIYGRSIDDVPTQRPVDVVANVAIFADAEHTEATNNKDRIKHGLVWATLSEAEIGLTELLATRVRVFDLSSLGYEFVGAGKCDAPLDKQPSGHLMYRKIVDGQPMGMVSLFVAPMRGGCKSVCEGMLPGEWQAAKAKSCKRRVLYSNDGSVLYFLVCCSENDQAEIGRAITLAQAPRR